jgi:NAD(P)-dependent dehydrogenase (short-subunit alcohol dehydrogenase family)
MFELAPGRRALVTGGASGLGLGIASALHAAGVRVAIADVDGAAAERAASDLSGALAVRMDVRDAGSVEAGVAAAVEALGGLDTLVTSAGVFAMGPFDTLPVSDWERVLAVNLTGTYLVCRAAAAHLRASGRGRVVTIASDGGKRGYANMAAYVASKHGVIGLTETMALELGPAGVTVNAVCPSTVMETGMGRDVLARKSALTGRAVAEIARERADAFPLGRTGTVDDVVAVVLFLVSEAAGWISGESINVDGGKLSG